MHRSLDGFDLLADLLEQLRVRDGSNRPTETAAGESRDLVCLLRVEFVASDQVVGDDLVRDELDLYATAD